LSEADDERVVVRRRFWLSESDDEWILRGSELRCCYGFARWSRVGFVAAVGDSDRDERRSDDDPTDDRRELRGLATTDSFDAE
jgi:hypothetical protein